MKMISPTFLKKIEENVDIQSEYKALILLCTGRYEDEEMLIPNIGEAFNLSYDKAADFISFLEFGKPAPEASPEEKIIMRLAIRELINKMDKDDEL